MDEKELLTQATDELSREGNIEEVQATLSRARTESFPMFLFMANAVKDVLVDPVFDLVSWGVVTYLAYILFLWAPLFIWNFAYLWAKLSFWRKIGIKVIWKYAAKLVVRALVAIGVASAIPFANMLFPQCLFILIAHNRHNRLVAELLVVADIVGHSVVRATASYAVSGGTPALAVRAVAEEYAASVASRAIEAADISGAIEERFGKVTRIATRSAVKRAEGGIVRVARKSGGRAIARGVIRGERWARELPTPAPQTRNQNRGGGGASVA